MGGNKVGQCNVLPCKAEHGETDCVHGKCLCSEGFCAGNDGFTCEPAPRCNKKVGTCSFFGCNKDHGATDCVVGACLCAEGTCSSDGYHCTADVVAEAEELAKGTDPYLFMATIGFVLISVATA